MGVDPGRTTGTATVTFDDGGSVLSIHTGLEVSKELLASNIIYQKPNEIVIEDFIGAGPRSQDTIYTLTLIGFVEGTAFSQGIKTTRQAPQARYCRMTMATSLIDLSVKMTQKKRGHMIDALAHVLSYYDHKRKTLA